MFVIEIDSSKTRCFQTGENGIGVFGFDTLTISNKLELNAALAAASVNSDMKALEAFYTGMAINVLNTIKIVPDVADDGGINYTTAFRVLFRNLGYKINEAILTNFNISLFVDSCMKLYNIRILPLLTEAKVISSKNNVLDYLTNLPISYSENDLLMLNKYNTTLIKGMFSLKLNIV